MAEERGGSLSVRVLVGGNLTTVALAASAFAPIDELKRLLEAVAVAIVSDDGRMLQSALPAGVPTESFAVMSATIVGAAATVSSDLKQTPPDHIVIRGVDFTTILSRFDPASLLVAVVGASIEPDQMLHRIDEFIVAQRPRPPLVG